MKLEILEHKGLLRELIKRELKRRYSESFLGFLWYILEPLFLLSILVFVFTVIFANQMENFAVFFLIGLLVFRFFSFGTISTLPCIVVNTSLINSRHLPRIIFPLTRVIVAFIGCIFELIVLFIFMLIFGVPFQILCLFIPLFLFLEIILTLGVGLILSTQYVRWRDLNVIWGIITSLLFWLLPVVYSIDQIPDQYQVFYKLNPLTLLIINLRDVILYARIPTLINFLYLTLSSFLVLGFGILLFNRRQKTFAEEI